MDFRHIILIWIHIINVLSKKYVSSSDESIENLLYFKDCQHKQPVPERMPLQATITEKPKGMDCPFPKMCCALTCGNECESSPYQSSFMGQQMESNFPPIGPMNGPGALRMGPRHPQIPQPPPMQRRKKKGKPGPMRMQMQPPIGGRRSFGFTKDRIKSLINQDSDIRKILKDLVRVTMKKVDLVDMINTRRAPGVPNVPSQIPEVPTNSGNNNEEEDDDDLE